MINISNEQIKALLFGLAWETSQYGERQYSKETVIKANLFLKLLEEESGGKYISPFDANELLTIGLEEFFTMRVHNERINRKKET